MANSWTAQMYGSFNSGAWLGEIATMTLSGAARDTGSFTAGAINESLIEFDAVPSGVAGSSTHFTWNYGSEGVGVWNNANVAAIGEACWTFLNAIKSYSASTFSWKEVRISAVESSGVVVNGASVGTITAPLVGPSSLANPPQTATVCSLVTGGRGPRNRGRLYVPAQVPSSGTDALVPTAQKTAINAATRSLINDVNGISGIRAAVVSRTHGTYSDIVSVRMGDEYDTQRRRRNGRRETYVSLAI